MTWVLPASDPWRAGATRGTQVISINAQLVSDMSEGAVPDGPVTELQFKDADGEIIRVVLQNRGLARRYAPLLWTIGGIIALLGVIVLLRRPDLQSAHFFALLALSISCGLGLGPTTSDVGHMLAIVLQLLSLIGVGLAFLPLSLSLIEGEEKRARNVFRVLLFVATGMSVLYLLSVVRFDHLYHKLRGLFALWVAASVVLSVAVLATKGTRQSQRRRKHAWVVLAGFGIAMFPFVFISLVPEHLGLADLTISPYKTAPLFIFIPIGFAVAILQYEMLGIRRLVPQGNGLRRDGRLTAARGIARHRPGRKQTRRLDSGPGTGRGARGCCVRSAQDADAPLD